MKRRGLAILSLLLAVCMGVSWAAYRAAQPAAPALSRYVPAGALLYLQAKDFSALLSDWNGSSEKQLWLKSASYQDFSDSRLLLRLADANTQFARTAGIPTDAKFLQQVAGRPSALAIFNIGNLEVLYITRLPSASAAQSALWQTRGKFETRSAGGITFFLRRDAESEREVAFAMDGEYLLLATREDLLAGALQLLSDDRVPSSAAQSASTQPNGAPGAIAGQGGPAPVHAPIKSIETEAWWAQAIAAAGAAGDLRMVLNLQKIVPSPYFRSYWIQKNVSEMKQYSAAVSDLVRSGNEYREERVLLRKPVAHTEDGAGNSLAAATPTASDALGSHGNSATRVTALPVAAPAISPEQQAAGASAVAALARLVPDDAGFYLARANPTSADCLALLENKLLAPHAEPPPADNAAPQVILTGGETGSSSDLETRIDQAPMQATLAGDSPGALKKLLENNPISAALQVESTELDNAGIFVRAHSSVALLAAADWDELAVRTALADFLRPNLTSGDLGIAWRNKPAQQELNGLWPLQLAVRGKYLFLSDNARSLDAMLQLAKLKTRQQPAQLLAGFAHDRERANFARLTSLLDKLDQAPAEDQEPAAPPFFSGNLASLSATLRGVLSQRIAIHDAGDHVTQSITYAWASR